jgi:hypothetical protein
MRHLVAALVLGACGDPREPPARTTAPERHGPPPAPSTPTGTAIEQAFESDHWTIAKRDADGDVSIVRIRTPLVPSGAAADYLHLLRVRCPQPGEETMPSALWQQAIYELEDRLTAAWESPRLALFVAVLSTRASREMLFYANDAATCAARFRAIGPVAGCTLEVTVDAMWQALHVEMLDGQAATRQRSSP